MVLCVLGMFGSVVTAHMRSSKVPMCDWTNTTITVGMQCGMTWQDLQPILHPTQPNLGYSWVQYKASKKMTSEIDAQDEMDEKIVPVVVGYNREIYPLDHHHVMAALDFSGFDQTVVTINVTCDYSAVPSLQSFWDALLENELAYPFARPQGQPNSLPSIKLTWDHIPTKFTYNTKDGSSFANDNWRSLVGFSRKIKSDTCPKHNKYCARAMIKVCREGQRGIPYFEFRWGYFFNDAYLNPDIHWPSTDAYNTFKTVYSNLETPSKPGTLDVDGWQKAAELLVPLARAEQTGSYKVPDSQLGCEGYLPGYAGPSLKPIKDADPDCGLPACSDFPPSPYSPN